jgi:hypothetical protein
MAGGGLVVGMIGLVSVVNAVGRDAAGVYDTVVVIVEALVSKVTPASDFRG